MSKRIQWLQQKKEQTKVWLDAHKGMVAPVSVLALGIGMQEGAWAFVTTGWTANTFAYTAYDLVVNQILKGPIGFVGGVIAICFGATQILKSWVIGLLCIVGGAVALKADSVVTSMGALFT